MPKTKIISSLRLCWGIFPAKTQRPQRKLWPVITVIVAAFCFQSSAFGQATGGVKGKIRNNRGEPISGASVTARQDSNELRSTTSNSKGEFTLSGLEPGTYTFMFDAAGYASAMSNKTEIRRNKTIDLGDRLILHVDKGTLVIVQGSVFFKDGTSATGAKVDIEKLNSDGTTRSFPAVYTNIYGEFTFRQPEAAAKFRITANYKDHTATKEIEVDSAAVYRLAIKLDVERDHK
jgi:Carboxypeptidase regulatory-like domain